jgi:phosphoribosyl 1,2-cyclic phosphodiesterase
MLASGSKGNSTYISDGRTAVLLDAGLSGIEIERRLRSRNLCPRNLSAIVVSHEHADHIHGVGVLSRRYRLPVFISRKTARSAPHLGRVHDPVYFRCGTSFHINSLTFRAFPLSHDAEDPVGFTIDTRGTKLGIATDLGTVTGVVRDHLQGCHVLVLEANHDPEMLISGPYPWPLKQRIQSRVGHLSNRASEMLLREILHRELKTVILAHLSETNNTPEKACATIAPVVRHHRIQLRVAAQDRGTDIIRIS